MGLVRIEDTPPFKLYKINKMDFLPSWRFPKLVKVILNFTNSTRCVPLNDLILQAQNIKE